MTMTNFGGNTVSGSGDPDRMVDDLLSEIAARDVTPDDDLMARVLGDAALVQQRRLEVPIAPKASVWAQVGQMIGGWPALGGLAAAGVAGLWIGVAPPADVESFAASLLGTSETVDLMGTGISSLFEDEIDG